MNRPIVICGGSSSGAFFAALWSSGALPDGAREIRMVTRRPERFAGPLTCRELSRWGRDIAPVARSGRIDVFDYKSILSAVENAECVWVCAPVHAFPPILAALMPAVAAEARRAGRTADDPLLVTLLYAQGGVDWMALRAAGGALPEGVGLCLLKNFPGIIAREGDELRRYGYHPDCAWFHAVPRAAEPRAERMLRALYVRAITAQPRSETVRALGSSLACALGGSNQILHPGVVAALVGPPPGPVYTAAPRVYRHVPWEAHRRIGAAMRDYGRLAATLDARFGTRILEECAWSAEMRTSLRLGATRWPPLARELVSWSFMHYQRRLRAARLPVRPAPPERGEGGLVFDPTHRFLADDLPYGLCVALGIAEIVGCPMPAVAATVAELQAWLGREYVVGEPGSHVFAGRDVAGTGAPQAYGVQDLEGLRALAFEGRIPAAGAATGDRPSPRVLPVRARRGLPPGPRGALVQVPLYFRRADLYYRRCLARWGDPFTEPTLFGPQVITGNPEGARQIFALPPEAADSFLPVLAAVLGPASLLVANGEVHRRGRRVLTRWFAGPRVASLAPHVHDITIDCVRRLAPDSRIDALTLAQQVTLDVILRVVFGVRDPRHAAALRAEVLTIVDHTTLLTLGPLLLPWFRGTLGHLPPWSRLQAAKARLSAILFDLVARGADEVLPDTVMAGLLDATDEDGQKLAPEELRDHLVTLLLAGHETTATTVAWGVYELCRHPEALAELRRSTRDLDPMAVARDPFANAVSRELLRLHPVGARVGRRLRQPMELCGYELPAGVAVAVSFDALHRDPTLYPEPDRFRPERFLERSYAPHEYIPFGGGTRRCIGAPLVHLELPIILATLFQIADLDLLDRGEVVPERRAITYGPRGRVPMRVARLHTGFGRSPDATWPGRGAPPEDGSGA